MTNLEKSQDLVILTADECMRFTMEGILERPEPLLIRAINAEVLVHIHRDPGCLKEGHTFLRNYVNQFKHALIILDLEGCGKEHKKDREEIEAEIEDRLSKNGWEGGRAAAIVIDPELENWMWSGSIEVDAAMGWAGKTPGLREWLIENKFLKKGNVKPSPPKDAMKQALKQVRKSWSSSIFLQIARKVSFKRCQDPAFLKLRETLSLWFPVS